MNVTMITPNNLSLRVLSCRDVVHGSARDGRAKVQRARVGSWCFARLHRTRCTLYAHVLTRTLTIKTIESRTYLLTLLSFLPRRAVSNAFTHHAAGARRKRESAYDRVTHSLACHVVSPLYLIALSCNLHTTQHAHGKPTRKSTTYLPTTLPLQSLR